MELNRNVIRAIAACHGELSAEETDRTINEIILLLKQKNITYGCAYNLLAATSEALHQSQSVLTL